MRKLFDKLKSKLRMTQFTAVSICSGNIKEKVHLKMNNGTELFDASLIHSPFCLDPLIVGVKIERDLIKNVKDFELIYSIGKKPDENNGEAIGSNIAARMLVNFVEFVDIKDEAGLLLLSVKKSKIFQLNMIERNELTFALYLHYLKKRNRRSINFLNNMCAVYSYPRKVILTVIKTESHFNIFPMDFVLHLSEEKFLLLGLNENNRSIVEIIENGKMIIADAAPSEKKSVYGLADQHRKDVKDVKNLPFGFLTSDLLNFPVPDFALGYKEIELVKHLTMGGHHLLVCKILNEKELKPAEPFLYHVHSIHLLHLRKNNLVYTVV